MLSARAAGPLASRMVTCQGLSHHTPAAAPATSSAATAGHLRRRDAPAGVTTIVAVALVFSCVAVTVALPGATPVASPAADTVTTSVLVDAHVTPRPAWVEPLVRRAVAESCTASPTATWTRPGAIVSPAIVAVVLPVRPSGCGLTGVLMRFASCDAAPAAASVTSCVRIGSSCASGAPPTAPTAASRLGQRWAGSFSSMRMTAAASSGGASARRSRIGAGGSLKCAYMIAMTESARNGSRPVSISYATTPSEY